MPQPIDVTPPKFIYLDLGNVLLFFDHHQAARQMAEAAGVDAQRVWEVVFASGLNDRYDAGQVTTEDFYETFCRETGARPDFDRLSLAASDIFRVNAPMKAVLAQLAAAGHRLGLLSNTCPIHWDYFADGRYAMIPDVFEAVALSFRLKLTKPDRAIFDRAAQLAGVEPQEIFYTDDMAGHVAGARAAGWDAVQYSGTPALVEQLRRRGVRFNY